MSPFTPGELEVMHVLWHNDELKPAEIQARLDRPLNNAALRSVLRVLGEKGHVTRRKIGKAYYYKPKRPAGAAFKRMARQLADLFCGGSTADLIAALIETESLSEADVGRLQQIARQQSGAHQPPEPETRNPKPNSQGEKP